jgi:uncharacterized protein YndB with AHSA1/START domain
MPATAKASSALDVALPSDREVLLTRVFDAPRELVFDALTNPEHLRHWFGPRGWTLAVCEVDLRVGGAWRYVLHGANGRSMGMHGVFREIVRPERLVSTECFDGFSPESVNTTTLTEENGKTTLTARVLCESKEIRDAVLGSGMERGAAETYDRLSEHLAAMAAAKPAQPELTMTRVFDAPRELVFRAWTDPERLKRWWGPKGFTNPVCEVDVRPGGAIRIHMRGPDGTVYPMTGAFIEIVEAERLVFTSSALDTKVKKAPRFFLW